MNLRELYASDRDAFMEALKTIDWHQVAHLLDLDRHTLAAAEIERALKDAAESIESEAMADVADPVEQSRRQDAAAHHRRIRR